MLEDEFAEQLKREQLEDQNRRVLVDALLYESTAEQLAGLGVVLSGVSTNEKMAAYFLGRVDEIMHLKYQVCSMHGVAHPDPLEEFLSTQGSTCKSDSDESLPSTLEDLPEGLDDVLDDEQEADDERALFAHFNLVRTDDGLITCIKCGKEYPSLADRMLRPPDHCEGCFTKAKNG